MKTKSCLLNLIQGYYLSKKVLSLFYSFKPSFSNLNMPKNYSIKDSSTMLTQASASIVLMLLKREDNFVNYIKIPLSNTSEKNLRYPFKEFKNKKRQ